MFKALLKKQLLELNSFYFTDRKTGKRRSKAKAAGFIALFAILFCVLGASFFAIAYSFAEVMITGGLSWLFFSIMGTIALLLGLFGSIFNTYSALYMAKDNEFLLSMPIKPYKILLARSVGVYLMGLLYESIVMIPALIAYFITAPLSFGAAAWAVVCYLLLSIMVFALTCLLGWVVAAISVKLKNKSMISAIFTAVFLIVYYVICFNFNNFINTITVNMVFLGEAIKGRAYPLYAMGKAFAGGGTETALFALFCILLTAVTFFVLSKTFMGIATSKSGVSAKRYDPAAIKAMAPQKALFLKERRRLFSSSTYLLNSSIGSIFMPIIGVAAIIFSGRIKEALAIIEMPEIIVCMIVAGAVFFIACMNNITAPSISLEGSSIWIVESLPVSCFEAIKAKIKLHLVMTLPPLLFMAVCLSAVMGIGVLPTLAILAEASAFVVLIACLGITVDLKRPVLSWTREVVPVKQNIGTMAGIFGGWVITIIISAGSFFASYIMPFALYSLCVTVILAGVCVLLVKWLKTRGTEIFSTL